MGILQMEMFNSLNKHNNQKISPYVDDKHLYSISVEDLEIVTCFLAHQKIDVDDKPLYDLLSLEFPI
jgi:hypothetical protein